MGCENLDAVKDEGKQEELRNWASFRGQTLSRSGKTKKRFNRYLVFGFWSKQSKKVNDQNLTSCSLALTVRGMMYYKEALKLQAFLDMAVNEGL